MCTLQAGADVAARNAHGMSPLLVASAGGHADCARLLLKLSDDKMTQVNMLIDTSIMKCLRHCAVPEAMATAASTQQLL